MSYIELQNVSVGYGSGTARTEVLKDINLTLDKGEFVAILGFSGTGKTTLTNLLAGMIMPDKGKVLVGGKEVKGPDPSRGLVFQNYSLLPWLNVHDNVALATNRAFPDESGPQKEARIQQAIQRVNLTPALHKRPGELSGGMRQRNSVARTLSMNPNVLLLDEPLSALDALTRANIQDEILGIWKAEGQTILLITNDVDEGLYMADRVIPLSMGPEATLGPVVINDAPRPRDRDSMALDPEMGKRRNQVIEFLLSERERARSAEEQLEVTLPNIKPLDISMSKPSWFKGMKTKPRKAVGQA
ncbi:MAG: ABC transporter ATP-binding protein [Verrucomicrobiota bacterium]